jgi:hypothetical protein
MAQTYDPVAVAVIQELIENNGLIADPDDPASWDFATWNDDQITGLDFCNSGLCELTGAVSFTELTNLKFLYCYGNCLTELNVSGLVNLMFLDCNDNNLTTLDASGCTNLITLICRENNLTVLNVNGCTNLKQLSCYWNYLTTLDVSGLVNLEVLDCEDNSLTALDLTGLVALVDFLGDYQNVTLTLQNDGANYTTPITLNNPYFRNSAISYDAGGLTSTSNTVSSTDFEVETGKSGYKLSGTMYFEYPTSIISPSITQIKVYPNPTNGRLTIENEKLTVENVEVYDVVGRVVQTFPVSAMSNETSIDISHLSAGIYFLQVGKEKVKVVKK